VRLSGLGPWPMSKMCVGVKVPLKYVALGGWPSAAVYAK
jgi:hypothetical protein